MVVLWGKGLERHKKGRKGLYFCKTDRKSLGRTIRKEGEKTHERAPDLPRSKETHRQSYKERKRGSGSVESPIRNKKKPKNRGNFMRNNIARATPGWFIRPQKKRNEHSIKARAKQARTRGKNCKASQTSLWSGRRAGRGVKYLGKRCQGGGVDVVKYLPS